MTVKETIDVIRECSDCRSKDIRYDDVHSEIICGKCGLILGEIIDQRPQKGFSDGEYRGHHGNAVKGDTDLCTVIGNDVKGINRNEMVRLRYIQKRNRLMNGVQRSMSRAIPKIERVASLMGLPVSVIEECKRIYRSAVKKRLIKGRSIDNIVTASLYATCRKMNLSRTLDEFAEATGIPKREIGRTYRFLAQQLGLRVGITDPGEYTIRFCSRLNLSGRVCMKSQEIIREATALELTSGKGPTGITAASIYIASIICCERRTQKEVAEASGVTEITIRNRYREISQCLGISIEA